MSVARRPRQVRRTYHHGDLLAALVAAARAELTQTGHRALSLRQGLTPILIGIAGGLGGAWLLTSLLKKELFQLKPHDPWTLAAPALLFFVVALAACWIPARRSAQVDPVIVLKAD